MKRLHRGVLIGVIALSILITFTGCSKKATTASTKEADTTTSQVHQMNDTDDKHLDVVEGKENKDNSRNNTRVDSNIKKNGLLPDESKTQENGDSNIITETEKPATEETETAVNTTFAEVEVSEAEEIKNQIEVGEADKEPGIIYDVINKPEIGENKKPNKENTKKEEDKNSSKTEHTEVDETKLMPWEKTGAKKPQEYTAKEYEALTTTQKEAFVASFKSYDEFNKWMSRVNGESDTEAKNQMPWEKSGAKQPKDYTWDEYESLTTIQKEAFYDSFKSAVNFDKWLNRVNGKVDSENSDSENVGDEAKDQMPWEKSGAKQPKDYTWNEYESLTAHQKEAFYDSFKGTDDFDKWVKRVNGNGDSDNAGDENTGSGDMELMPWEDGGKQPEDYTWKEYKDLTALQKEAFFESFDSTEDFDSWMSRVTGENSAEDAETDKNGSEDMEPMPWEEDDKQPEDYTWEEYKGLTALQKEAFFESFDSSEEFDEWMNEVRGNSKFEEIELMPWEEGGKQPEEYTWKEYKALTALQKEAFYESFEDIEAFDEWLTMNQP